MDSFPVTTLYWYDVLIERKACTHRRTRLSTSLANKRQSIPPKCQKEANGCLPEGPPRPSTPETTTIPTNYNQQQRAVFLAGGLKSQ